MLGRCCEGHEFDYIIHVAEILFSQIYSQKNKGMLCVSGENEPYTAYEKKPYDFSEGGKHSVLGIKRHYICLSRKSVFYETRKVLMLIRGERTCCVSE